MNDGSGINARFCRCRQLVCFPISTNTKGTPARASTHLLRADPGISPQIGKTAVPTTIITTRGTIVIKVLTILTMRNSRPTHNPPPYKSYTKECCTVALDRPGSTPQHTGCGEGKPPYCTKPTPGTGNGTRRGFTVTSSLRRAGAALLELGGGPAGPGRGGHDRRTPQALPQLLPQAKGLWKKLTS